MSQKPCWKTPCGSSLFKSNFIFFFRLKNRRELAEVPYSMFENCFIYPNRSSNFCLPWKQGPYFRSNCGTGSLLWRFITAVCLQGTTHLWREREIILQVSDDLQMLCVIRHKRNSFTIDRSMQSQHCCLKASKSRCSQPSEVISSETGDWHIVIYGAWPQVQGLCVSDISFFDKTSKAKRKP